MAGGSVFASGLSLSAAMAPSTTPAVPRSSSMTSRLLAAARVVPVGAVPSGGPSAVATASPGGFVSADVLLDGRESLVAAITPMSAWAPAALLAMPPAIARVPVGGGRPPPPPSGQLQVEGRLRIKGVTPQVAASRMRKTGPAYRGTPFQSVGGRWGEG